MAMLSNAEQMKVIKDQEVEWVSKMQSCEQNLLEIGGDDVR